MFLDFNRKPKDFDDDPYRWTCGVNPDIVRIKEIGVGGYGEVHEVTTIFPVTLPSQNHD